MKHLSALAAACLTLAAAAQCPFNPTISPDPPILCPDEQMTLSTQVYDSYQWYKDNLAILGATSQNLTVTNNDIGSYFFVEATLDSCTESSPSVLVDGWVFLLPHVIHYGDEPNYSDSMGQPHHCVGDTVILDFSMSENIVWTNNGVPIPGETDDTLIVTENSNISASGAPAECPNFIMQLGVTIGVVFDQPVQPMISAVGDQLCVAPAGNTHQWYMDGNPLIGNAACITATAPGTYTVDVTYDTDCALPAEPFIITGINTPIASTATAVFPSPARDRVTINWPGGAPAGPWQMQDATGRVVMRGHALTSTLVLSLDGISTGRYWISAKGQRPLPVTVVK
jgi:hypothetical protein